MVRVPIIQKVDFSKEENDSCKDSFIITDFETGEIICQNCGAVIQSVDSQASSNKNLFKNFDYTSHGGNTTSLRFHDMGLATIIGKFNQDFSGKSLDYSMKPVLKRMRLWDSRSQARNSAERNLRYALLEMEKLKEKLSLSDAIMERSAYLYRKAANAQLIRGRSIKGVLGACVYIACKEMDATRTLLEISNNLQENKNSISRNYRMLFQNLNLIMSVPDFTKCIIKISNNLEIPESTKREAIQIFDIVKEKKLTAGKKPNAVAATVIYMASIKTNLNLSQQEIGRISGVSPVTIRNRYKEYIEHVKLM